MSVTIHCGELAVYAFDGSAIQAQLLSTWRSEDGRRVMAKVILPDGTTAIASASLESEEKFLLQTPMSHDDIDLARGKYIQR